MVSWLDSLRIMKVFFKCRWSRPSSLDTPSAWVNNGVYPDNPTGTFVDPIACGPSSSDIVPGSVDASYEGTNIPPQITHRTSYFDLGANSGAFISQATSYINYIVNDIPDTDLIIKIEEADRSILTQ